MKPTETKISFYELLALDPAIKCAIHYVKVYHTSASGEEENVEWVLGRCVTVHLLNHRLLLVYN